MIGFAEDMSYNNGPMLSRECFDEFILPHYKDLVPMFKERGIPVLADSDGQIEPLIPWLKSAGIDGAYPLERQAGVDIPRIRQRYPDFIMMGGYDKMVMSLGEEAVRAEFERLLPAMRSGGYIVSVDHQTPPGVSLDDYRVYSRLLGEYARKGAEHS
jgi:uroporphyrinogen-III decarboxylase